MSEKTLMVLGAGPLQIPAITTAKRMGLRVVVLDGNPAAPGLPFADLPIVVDISSPLACLDVATREKVDGVIHICSEVAMNSLGLINETLHLAGPDCATVVRATNKVQMRRAFEAGNAPSPQSIEAATLEEARIAVGYVALPSIIKPSRNSGSRGITRLGPGITDSMVIRAFREALEQSRDHSVVVEHFVDGPEFSVEILSWNGRYEVLAVTDKVTTGNPHFVETGHSQPTRFSSDARQKVVEAALKGVKALGITWSAAHAEVKLTPEGPFLMEIGARLGGDFITTELVPRSTGIDMVAAAISLALGEEPDLKPQHAPQGVAIRYLTPSRGVISSIIGVEQARFMPGVQLVQLVTKIGDFVPEISSSLSRVGHVIAEGPTADEAIARAEAARDAIHIKTEAQD
jgi:biotin carboxylase